MQTGKTIKQIADEIGVSKQAISYRLKQLEKENDRQKNRQNLVVKENGLLVVSLAGETLIKKAFLENDRQTFTTKEPPKDRQKEDGFLAVLKATINMLEKQLLLKDKQIEELQKELNKEREHSREQSEKISVLADQAQKLQLAQMTPAVDNNIDAQEIEKTPEKLGFFQRFFGNK